MKNKKGFTLVELLAVIVILAIILVITVPQIMKTIESARLGAFKSTAKLLLSQAEKQYLVDQTLSSEEKVLSYSGTGDGNNQCGKLAKLGDDYTTCTLTVNESTGTATLTSLVGANKFAKYSCTGATLSGTTSVDSNCTKSNS